MTIEYRTITTRDEVEQAVTLYSAIWTSGEREAIPYHVLIAIMHAGGFLLGAFDSGQLIGMALSFLGLRDGKALHWSHLAGVHPDCQSRGVGSDLKWLQRRLVLEQGYDCIAWTYHPLQRRNAAFNIYRLGCVCNRYQVEFYGEMHDGLNAGLPSDRFEVRWWLNGERVLRRLREGLPPPSSVEGLHSTLTVRQDGGPGDIHWPDQSELTTVEIPADINLLRTEYPDVAQQWSFRTREVFTRLFAEGFCVVDFASPLSQGSGGGRYLLRRGGDPDAR